MLKPFIARRVNVELRAERPLVQREFGALVDDRAPVARERQAVLFALEEILPDLRANLFKKKTQMSGDRIIAKDRMMRLQEIADADDGEADKNNKRKSQRNVPSSQHGAADDDRQRDGGKNAERQDDESRRKRQGQCAQ